MEPLYRVSVVRRLLAEYGLQPTKSLGQNFLVDQNTLERIVSGADIRPGDVVLEVGPGLGTLTQALLDRGARVVAIEKDHRLVVILERLFGDNPMFTLVHDDALKVDLGPLLQPLEDGGRAGGSLKVVSNLPYYVTTPLIMHFLESPLPFERIVLLLQHEVGLRLAARPGTKEYGALSVAVAYRAEVTSLGVVPPTVFYPRPNVSSQIVVLTPRPSPYPVGCERTFSRVVRAAFGQRRKTLRNALKELKLEPEALARAFEVARIDPDRRGESLSLVEFARLSAALSQT